MKIHDDSIWSLWVWTDLDSIWRHWTTVTIILPLYVITARMEVKCSWIVYWVVMYQFFPFVMQRCTAHSSTLEDSATLLGIAVCRKVINVVKTNNISCRNSNQSSFRQLHFLRSRFQICWRRQRTTTRAHCHWMQFLLMDMSLTDGCSELHKILLNTSGFLQLLTTSMITQPLMMATFSAQKNICLYHLVDLWSTLW